MAPAQTAAAAIAGFISGVGAAGFSAPAIGCLVAASAAGIAFSFWKKAWALSVIAPLACAIGMFYYHAYWAVRAASVSVPFDVPLDFSGIVAGEPGHSAKSEYFDLRLADPWRGTLRVIAAPGIGLQYGDFLTVRGRVRKPQQERDAPAVIFPAITRIDAGRGHPVRQALSGLKHRLVNVLPLYLPDQEAALMAGITLGAKADFSPELIAAMAASGTTHLVALSGYNIAILVLVIFGSCLSLFGRRPAFYLTTLALALFVIMVGAEPSVVRAAAMGFVVLLARELGRPHGLAYSIGWTAFLMILFDPGAPFMPGFQLSFMSLLGIIYLSPVCLWWLGLRKGQEAGFLHGLRENAALTIAAQLAVAPIALNGFGGVSLTAFLANALILPLIPMTMFLGFALIACGLLFPALGFLAGILAHIFLSYEIGAIRFFALFRIPITAALPPFGVIIYYLVIIILIRRHALKEHER